MNNANLNERRDNKYNDNEATFSDIIHYKIKTNHKIKTKNYFSQFSAVPGSCFTVICQSMKKRRIPYRSSE